MDEPTVEPVVEDEYAKHVARLREQRSQVPVISEDYTLKLSENAMRFLIAAVDYVRATTPTSEKGKEEVNREIDRVVQERIRAQDDAMRAVDA